MARPSKYGAEFRSDAIAFWRASVGRRTVKDVAADPKVSSETLRTWVRDGDGRSVAVGGSQDTETELAQLRAENARLVEAWFGFAFTDDHRAFLAMGLPTRGGGPAGATAKPPSSVRSPTGRWLGT
ncbi:transposase [Streptomyces sp. NPDC059802]|uniref:transposase n=1 Tax=Streptomyces sp. NPDC059802 TaxID=3346952 RepID=UPI0036557C1C